MPDDRAAAQADGNDIRHPEIGAHAADGDRYAGFPGEPVLNDAKVSGGAAHINDNGIADLAEVRGTSDGVGGAAGDGEDGIFTGVLHSH